MNMFRFTGRSAIKCLLGLPVAVALNLAQAQVAPTHREEVPAFDLRTNSVDGGLVAQQNAGRAHLSALLPAAKVSFNPLLGSPSFIMAEDGFLTGPGGQGRAVTSAATAQLSPGDPYFAIKGFLNENSQLFGYGAEILNSAVVRRQYTDAHNGMRTVIWEQKLDGIPVFDSLLKGHTTSAGELISVASLFLPNLSASADAGTPNRLSIQAAPPVTSSHAIMAAAAVIGSPLTSQEIHATGSARGEGGYSVFKAPFETLAREVWLPLNRNSLRLAWEVQVTSKTTHERFRAAVDAITGQVLVLNAMTRYLSDATYNVYTSDSPSPFSPGSQAPGNTQPAVIPRVLVTTPAYDTNASPAGWINDTDNTTTGNNTDAYLDRDFDQLPDQARPVGNPNRVFNFPLDLSLDPTNYIDAATVQMFYWINAYHDRVYELGFTEAAGNYQEDNFGRGGQQNDRILSYVQSGADVGFNNNAFFSPAPDGFNGQIAMFTWDGPIPNRDGDLDAEVILHEATHGTSERLVGGGVLISALQTAGMGEGWSDFYSLSILSQASDDPDAAYAVGGYATYRLFGLTQNYYYGVRHFPYCTDMTKNPFTFKDIDPGQISPHNGVPRSPIYPFFSGEASEVHHQGEIWCMALLEVRANLIHKYGPNASDLMLQTVTDAMKLGPANPTFLEARDAILLADRVDNGGANQAEIWRGFAKRGMGYSARSPISSTTAGVVEAFDTPGLNIDHVVISGGNGNGIIDFNECNDMLVYVVNNSGALVTGVSGRLSTTTTNVIVVQSQANYPNIPAGLTNVNITPFRVSTAPNFICGTPIDFTLVLKADQSTTTNTFRVQTGQPGTPLKFGSIAPVLIPDNNPAGTNSYVMVSNVTSAITRVTVGVYITHPFDSDLVLQLVSPDGVTNTLAAHRGAEGDNYGVNCAPDSSLCIFDDTATIPIGSGTPPYVGSYIPEQPLSVYAGKSGTNVNGLWALHVRDDAQFDIGIVQCWTLSLTSVQCQDGGGECPGADLAIGMSSQPEPVILGNTLVYTISVTNNGPSSAKNVTVSHILPAGAVFISASPSQGSYSQSGGIVTANLGTINARGRATIVITVLPTAAATVTSTATVTSDQTDFDVSNNSVSLVSHVNAPSADLAVRLSSLPEPVVLGANVTYTVFVTNNGPSTASGVVVSNAIPAGVAVVSANASQGSLAISNNNVIISFGSITNSGVASAVINATAITEGLFTATATVTENQLDPISSNNVAVATTTIGPAADIGVTIVDSPDPVVVGSNVNYVITITNSGPSIATGVTVSGTLPAGATIVSSNSSQGSFSISGGALTANLGTLAAGNSATINLRLFVTTSGTIAANASATSTQADPNTANNSASASTLVAPPFVSVVAAGATITAESAAPTNGAVDLGETVTMTLRLRNSGNVNTTNLTATLLATNGITPLGSASQAYGVLPAGGVPTGRPFTFVANGTNGGSVTAVLSLQDGSSALGVATFTFGLPTVLNFSNTAAITIRDATNGLPYPSVIAVSNVVGVVGKVTATLSNISHTFPQDVDVLLTSPSSSQTTILMAGAGASLLNNANVTFDDNAANPIPDGSAPINSGSYRPANYMPGYNLPPPAPAGPYAAAMSSLNAGNPNGLWSLFVDDHAAGDSGVISGGWSLGITLISPVNQLAEVSIAGLVNNNPALAGSSLTYTFTVTNAGPNNASFVGFSNAIPAGVTVLSATASQGAVTTNGSSVVVNIGPLNAGAAQTVTIVALPSSATAGLLTNTASVTASEIDLNPANNSASVVSSINLPLADLSVAITSPSNIVVGSNATIVVSITNNGPGTALAATITNGLPGNLSFVSATPSSGSVSLNGGNVIANAGNLGSGSAATVSITVHALSLGTGTNSAKAGSNSSDTNAANNAASQVIAVVGPSPSIQPAGASLASESFAPANGGIDAGETVSISLVLTNAGSANANNLVATLLPTGGVTPVGNAQRTYGTLLAGGSTAAQTFTLTANGASGAPIDISLQLQDGATSLGTVTFTYFVSSVSSFANAGAITIPDHGAGFPYPSTINVSGLTGLVSQARVILNGFSHSFPRDVNILLVAPNGSSAILMSHAGGANAVTNATLTFEDAAIAALPATNAITSGTYLPGAYGASATFLFPAPGGVHAAALSSVNGSTPNGTWSLYVMDDSVGDAGSIGGGWTLQLTTVSAVNLLADLAVGISSGPASVLIGGVYTNVITVTNLGPNAASNVTLTNYLSLGLQVVGIVASQGTFAVSSNNYVSVALGGIAPGTTASLTTVLAPSFGATITNRVQVSGAESDLNPANNSALTTVGAVVPAQATLSAALQTNQIELTLIGQANASYTVQYSTNLANWATLSTTTANGAGVIKVVDPVTGGSRYYRAVRVLP